MNLYKIHTHDPDEGEVFVWAGTQFDARQAVKQMRNDFPRAEKAEVDEVNFPTDKPSLLRWLNEHFTRDNG